MVSSRKGEGFRELLIVACAGIAAGWVAAQLQRRRRVKKNDVPLVFEGCEVHRLTSPDGLRYKLIVSLPFSYYNRDVPANKFPVVYALDAEPYLFPLLATVARTNHFFKRTTWYPDLIIVGITADLDEIFTNDYGNVDVRGLWDALRPTRARDYLPTAAESPWGAPGAESLLEVSGHATEFVRFLASSVIPFVDHTYRTEKSQRALIGKSFGGSGVGHAMLDELCAPLFRYYLLGSPSLSWDDKAFFRLEEDTHKTRQPLEASIYASRGGKEQGQAITLEAFKTTLESRGYPALSVTLEVVDGEDHGSLSYPFACRAMAWLRDELAKSDASLAASHQ